MSSPTQLGSILVRNETKQKKKQKSSDGAARATSPPTPSSTLMSELERRLSGGSTSSKQSGATTTSATNAAATYGAKKTYQRKLFTASKIEKGNTLDSLAISDISAVASLKKEMTQAQHVREGLKQLIDDAQYLVTNHHGQYALENVTTYRDTEILREKVLMKEDRIRRLKKEVEMAEQEFSRLSDVNRTLLKGVREKDKEKNRVMLKLESHEYCERTSQSFAADVSKKTLRIHDDKNDVVNATHSLVSKLGKHHSEVMVLEQEMIDLKLEAELLRSKLGLSRNATTQRSNQWYFRSCENAQCVRDRQNLRQAKERLAMVETTLRISGNLHKTLNLSSGGGAGFTNNDSFSSSVIVPTSPLGAGGLGTGNRSPSMSSSINTVGNNTSFILRDP